MLSGSSPRRIASMKSEAGASQAEHPADLDRRCVWQMCRNLLN